jgi:hypothetical protein
MPQDQPSDAFSATETHVPRAWYDSQRAALLRAEGQVVALTVRCTELHRQLEAKASRREVAATAVTPAKPTAAPRTPKLTAAPELEITF